MSDPFPKTQANSGQPFFLDRLDSFIARYLSLPDSPLLQSIRASFVSAMPLLLLAAFAQLIKDFPLLAYQQYMIRAFGPDWFAPCDLVHSASIHFFAVLISISLSYHLAVIHNERHPGKEVRAAGAVLICLVALLLVMGPQQTESGLVLPWAGIQGLFASLAVTLCFMALFLRLSRIQALRSNFFTENDDPLFTDVFRTIIPALLALGIVINLRLLASSLGAEDPQHAFYMLLQHAFEEEPDSLLLGVLYTSLVQISWFFGIHGADLLEPVTQQVFQANMLANTAAFNTQQVPPHLYTKLMFETFVFIGGSGATLGLVLALLTRSKTKETRRIAAIGLAPCLFNINELLLFGVPLVFNPVYLIPFIIAPVLLLFVSSAAFLSGLVPQPIFATQWTTPPLINAFIATGSWRGPALQLVNIALAAAVYLPFIALADNRKKVRKSKAFSNLLQRSRQTRTSRGGRQKNAGTDPSTALAKQLGEHLCMVIDTKDPQFTLHFQPRVNMVSKRVSMMEALIRWQHPVHGLIPPELTFSLAEQAGGVHMLENRILSLAVLQLAEWQTHDLDVAVVINVSEHQLMDKMFGDRLLGLLHRFNLNHNLLVLEVNEEIALDPLGTHLPMLQQIAQTGVRLSIDNYGQHMQSLNQLRHFPLTDLQISQALVGAIAFNKSCQDIVAAIQETCAARQIAITAGYVESREQLETLLELNITTFQGYLFSEAVPPEDCTAFLKEHNQ